MWECPDCGQSNKLDSRFCSNCDYEFGTDDREEVPLKGLGEIVSDHFRALWEDSEEDEEDGEFEN